MYIKFRFDRFDLFFKVDLIGLGTHSQAHYHHQFHFVALLVVCYGHVSGEFGNFRKGIGYCPFDGKLKFFRVF